MKEIKEAQQAAPAVQSDTDLAREIRQVYDCRYPMEKDDEVTALIARHVEARTRPLVEALEAAQDLIEGQQRMLDGKGCREYDHKKVRWENAKALAQEKGQADGN